MLLNWLRILKPFPWKILCYAYYNITTIFMKNSSWLVMYLSLEMPAYHAQYPGFDPQDHRVAGTCHPSAVKVERPENQMFKVLPRLPGAA